MVFCREVALDKSSGVSKPQFPCVARRGGQFWPFLQDQLTSDDIDKVLGIMSHNRGKIEMLSFLYF